MKIRMKKLNAPYSSTIRGANNFKQFVNKQMMQKLMMLPHTTFKKFSIHKPNEHNKGSRSLKLERVNNIQKSPPHKRVLYCLSPGLI